MRGVQRLVNPAPGGLTGEAFDALRALGPGTPAPILLGYHPPVTGNPFLHLLYKEAFAARIAPVPVWQAADIPEFIELGRLGHRAVLHLHWLNKQLRYAKDDAEARAAGEAFLERIASAQAAGVRVLWTVHNILPHEARYPATEAWFRGEVARRVDLVHVMAARTPELVAPYFDIPRDRIVHVPHPSYAGAYSDIVRKDTARHQLGIMPDETVYLVLGAIQGYKGIGELLDAWDRLPDDGRPRRLVIAGAPSKEPGIGDVLERATLHPTVQLYPARVDNDRMQVFLRAADLAVLPYLRSLNSGALLLALTFGLPVIVPQGTGLADLVDPATGRTFAPGDPDGLAVVLAEAASLATPEASAAAIAAAARYDPSRISRQLADAIRSRLFDDAPAAAGRPPTTGEP